MSGVTTKLTLTGPKTATIGQQVQLTGSLVLSVGGTLPAGTPVTVTRSNWNGVADEVLNLQTAADGSFSLNDTPPAAQEYTYTARYAGDATTAPATAYHVVGIGLLHPSLTLSTGKKTYTYEPTVHVTAHLGPTYTNRKVSIYAEVLGSRARRLLKSGTVGPSGDLTVSYAAPHSTIFIAVFSGDAHDAAVKVTRIITVRVKVTEALSGYYGSKVIGSTTYRLYHRTAVLRATGTVAPGKKGQCLRFEVQEHANGRWYTQLTNCGTLSSSSQVVGSFTLTHADIGYPYRIRAVYLQFATDYSNADNDSPWQYLKVEP